MTEKTKTPRKSLILTACRPLRNATFPKWRCVFPMSGLLREPQALTPAPCLLSEHRRADGSLLFFSAPEPPVSRLFLISLREVTFSAPTVEGQKIISQNLLNLSRKIQIFLFYYCINDNKKYICTINHQLIMIALNRLFMF